MFGFLVRRQYAQSRKQIDSLGSAVRWQGSVDKRGGGFISIGSASVIEGRLVCNLPGARIQFGERCFLGGGAIVDCALDICIGDDVLIGYQSIIADHNSHSIYWPERANDVRDYVRGVKDWSSVPREAVTIGPRCWVGARCIVLKGVSLGEGCVVAAGSVVTRSFLPHTLIAGNPARSIRTIPQEAPSFAAEAERLGCGEDRPCDDA